MNGETGLSADVFEPLTNETRLAILRALAEAASETPADPWVEYTDLRDAAGVRDNGNFNYHLDRLGEFVEKRPAGYRLSHVGMVAVTTMAAGGFDADWTWGPVDAPGECQFCERPVELRYEDGACWLACGDEDHAMALSASPRLLAGHPDDDRDALFERVAFADHRWAESTRRGVCSECRGHVAGRIERGGVQPDHYHYRGRCRGCGFQHGVPLGLFLASHPSVVAFCHDHGVDVRTTPFWTLAWCRPGTETVCSEDPFRVRVDVALDGDCLSLTVAEDGTVVETTRE
jgi:hypothetical protein